MENPTHNQFEKNAKSFNKRLLLFVLADIVLLIVASIAFVMILGRSAELNTQGQEVVGVQDESKPNSNSTIEQNNQGLDVIQKEDDESGLNEQDQNTDEKNPQTEKPSTPTTPTTI